MMLRLVGGKGGFGSKLKAQGARMATKKTTNFESCRDLTGLRLKTIHDAKALKDYIDKEPERVKAKQDLNNKKIRDGLRQNEKKRDRFDEELFDDNRKVVLNQISSAVAHAVKKPKITANTHVPKRIIGW
jgi:hypothetical protein